MRILLLSDSAYLYGFLKGFCLDISCEYEVNAIDDCTNFLDTIINKPPFLIFIDMMQISQLLSMTEWFLAERFIKDNHIILCGFGVQPSGYGDARLNSIFKKIFSAPSSEEKMLIFLKEKLLEHEVIRTERRASERRTKIDRRKSLTQEYFTSTRTPISSPTLSIVRSVNSLDEQKNSDSNMQVGSVLINRLHKVITINGTPVDLSNKEFEIMDYLATHTGKVIETENIIKKVWANGHRATKADVHQYVHMLRKKIEIDPKNPKLLITVKGFGYELRP